MTEIRISRSKYIERDRSIAVIRLNEEFSHVFGQLTMVRYYTDETNTTIDTIVAVGIKNGIGKDCYSIISSGEFPLIRNVVYELPDVSELVHDEIFLYYDSENNTWNQVFLVGDERVIQPIEGGPYKYLSIQDNYIWYFDNNTVIREGDAYSKGAIDLLLSNLENKLTGQVDNLGTKITQLEEELGILSDTTNDQETRIDQLEKLVYPLEVSLTNNIQNLIYDEGVPTKFTFNVQVLRNKVDVTNDCIFTLNGELISVTSNTFTKTVSSSTDFTLEVKLEVYDLVTTVNAGQVNFGNTVYYGIVDLLWESSTESITGLTNNLKIVNIGKFEINWENLSIDKTFVFSYPVSFGKLISALDSNSLDYIYSYSIDEVLVNGINYFVCKFTNPIELDKFVQTYQF